MNMTWEGKDLRTSSSKETRSWCTTESMIYSWSRNLHIGSSGNWMTQIFSLFASLSKLYARNRYCSCWVPVDYWKYSRFGLPRVHLETDNKWYRGRPKASKSLDNVVIVFMLDYGERMLCNRKGDSGLLWNVQLMQSEKNYFCASHNWHKLCVFVCVMTNRVCGNQNASHNLHLRKVAYEKWNMWVHKFLSNTGNPFGSPQFSFVTHRETTIQLVSIAAA